MALTEQQWNIVKDILPEDPVREDRGVRPWSDRHETLNDVLWILLNRAPWKDMSSRYGANQTGHPRFRNWVQEGIFEKLLLAITQDLQERGDLDLNECFMDGTFVAAKKRGGPRLEYHVVQASKSYGNLGLSSDNLLGSRSSKFWTR